MHTDDDTMFRQLVFLNWTQREADAAERAAYDEYVAKGVATAIAFTYPGGGAS